MGGCHPKSASEAARSAPQRNVRRNMPPQCGDAGSVAGRLLLRNPFDILPDSESGLPPHPDPLPRGEGTASEDSCCSTPAPLARRSDTPTNGGRFSLYLGERAGV